MADFSSYLIATDLDGTFFGPGAALVERNLEAVRRFRAGGGLFTLNTGRQPYNIQKSISDPASLINAPAIMSNGVLLYDFESERAFEVDYLDEAAARGLMAIWEREFPEAWLRAPAADVMRIERRDAAFERWFESYSPEAVRCVALSEWRYDNWYKVCWHDLDEARLECARKRILAELGDRLYVTTSGVGMLEIQNVRCNKAVGIEKLRRHCGEERIVIACGDYDNDLEMLAAADISVCPENALPSVKAVADYTLCHHSEGLIADVVERIERGELTERKKRNAKV